MAGLSIANTIFGLLAQRQQSKALGSEQRFRDRLAAMGERDAFDRGREAEVSLLAQTNSLIGTQRVGYASQGIDISSGTALDVQAQAAGMSERDIITLKNNAAREAWGIRTQNVMDKAATIRAQAGIKTQQASTLTSGATDLYRIFRKER